MGNQKQERADACMVRVTTPLRKRLKVLAAQLDLSMAGLISKALDVLEKELEATKG